MLIQSTIEFWELSKACSILVYVLDHRFYMDVWFLKEHVMFIYLGESSDDEKLIAASIDQYFEER